MAFERLGIDDTLADAIASKYGALRDERITLRAVQTIERFRSEGCNIRAPGVQTAITIGTRGGG